MLSEMKGLAARGHELTLVTRPQCRIRTEAEKAGLRVTTLPLRRATDLGSLLALRRLLSQQAVDVVNTHSGVDNWIGGLAAKLAGTPVLLRTRHLNIPLKRNWLNFVHYLPDRIITCGEAMRRQLIEIGGFPEDQLVSIATGIDFESFRPQLARKLVRERLGIPETDFVILMVGIIRTVKRHEIALRSLPASPQLARPVGVGGRGPIRVEVEQLARDLGILERVQFLGFRSDVADLMGASDLLLLTSVRGRPAVTQALGLGLPVVATRVGGVPELVEHEQSGFWFRRRIRKQRPGDRTSPPHLFPTPATQAGPTSWPITASRRCSTNGSVVSSFLREEELPDEPCRASLDVPPCQSQSGARHGGGDVARHMRSAAGYTALGADQFLSFLTGQGQCRAGACSSPSTTVIWTITFTRFRFAAPRVRPRFSRSRWIADGPLRRHSGDGQTSDLPATPDHRACKAAIAAGRADNVMLRWSEMQRMESAGVIEIHSHTHSHIRWDELYSEPAQRSAKLTEDLELSKEALRRQLGKDSRHLCWPWGYFEPDYLAIAEQTGFQAQYTVAKGVNVAGTNPQQIARIVTKDRVGRWFANRMWIYSRSWAGRAYNRLRGE